MRILQSCILLQRHDQRENRGERRCMVRAFLHEIADPDLPDIAKALLAERAAARKAKDFAKSDQLRDELAGIGISVKDVKDGQEWSWQTK